MKKILKTVLSAAILCLTAVIMSVCVSAETEDVELPTTIAKSSNGTWGQSITFQKTSFDCSRFTPDTVINVEFELDGEWTGNGAPVELILQNFSTADPQIWAKVEPFEYDETTASFQYEDMVAAYGSDDFSGVDNMCLGDCGIVMKATKFVVTNCEKVEITTTEATTTEAVTESTTAAETTAAETTAETAAAETEAPSESGGGSIPIIPIVIITVVVAVAIVVVIIIVKNKRRFY